MSKKLTLEMNCPACLKANEFVAPKPGLAKATIGKYDCVGINACGSFGFLKVEKVSSERRVTMQFIRFTISDYGRSIYDAREFEAKGKEEAKQEKIKARREAERLLRENKIVTNANNGANEGVTENATNT